MNMKWILAASLVLNIVLGVWLFERSLIYHNRVRFWFIKKPDFVTVEAVAKEILTRPEFVDWFEFKEFSINDPWMADLDVVWKQEITGENWQVVRRLATAVSKEVNLPCWPYKMLMDPADPSRRIGGGFGIGYSRVKAEKKDGET